jgi:hypothetical protein
MAAEGVPKIWETVPRVEMKSEVVLPVRFMALYKTGTLATTFTASRFLLVVILDMNKIAG